MKNRMFNIVGFVLIVIIFIVAQTNAAQALEVGDKAPDFKVLSGDDKELRLSDVTDKVIVLFYETKDEREKNRKLKDELNKYYDAQKDEVKKLIYRLPVINCSDARSLAKGIWKNKMRKFSEKEGIVIYGDWDKKMFHDYKVKDKDSNFMIIDEKGVVRYSKSGLIDDAETKKIMDLLKELSLK